MIFLFLVRKRYKGNVTIEKKIVVEIVAARFRNIKQFKLHIINFHLSSKIFKYVQMYKW